MTPLAHTIGKTGVQHALGAEEIEQLVSCIVMQIEQLRLSGIAAPNRFLIPAGHEDKLVILDEVHRVPELFQGLRGLIDRGRHKGDAGGKRNGRFLLLGPASMDLPRQSGVNFACISSEKPEVKFRATENPGGSIPPLATT